MRALAGADTAAQSTLAATAAPWTHGWPHKTSWGQALSPAGDAKGHLCLQLTDLHSRLFLWGRHWPEEMRHQRASVMAVARADGTSCTGQGTRPNTTVRRHWLCPAQQREALSEGSPRTRQIGHQPWREGGQCSPVWSSSMR